MAKVMTERRREPAERAQVAAKKPPAAPAVPKHLAAIAKAPKDELMALVFWKLRNHFPDFAAVITEHDIKGYEDSMQYCGQSPKLIVTAAQTTVTVRIADAKTGDMIRVEENNEADLDRKELAAKVRRVKEGASNLVMIARSEQSQGMNSEDTIRNLCDSLLLLARQ